MSELLSPLIIALNAAIELFKLIVLVYCVLSFLLSMKILNTQNRFVYTLVDALYRVTEPVLRPLRRILPDTGGWDLSPVLLFFILWLVQMYLPIALRHL